MAVAVMRMLPVRPKVPARTLAWPSDTSSSARRAWSTMTAPSAVGRTARVVRSKSRTPNEVSSRLIAALTAAVESLQRLPAPVRLPVSAVASSTRRASRLSNSMED